jgi:uncharacterized protein with GYD domain
MCKEVSDVKVPDARLVFRGGVRGLLKEGGVSRRSHFRQLVEKLGGKLEAFYYAFGGDDIYAIVELPDNVDSLDVSMAVTAGDSFRESVVVR